MLGVVVVFGEFAQHVGPVVSSLAVKIFSHYGLSGSVEPFHDGGLLFGLLGKVADLMTLQEIPNADVVELLFLVELGDIRVLTEPCFEFVQR